jgi:uncharacterized protein (TIGR02246 family)
MTEKPRSHRVLATTPKDVHTALTAAFNARDLDSYVALYEEDGGMIIPPDGRRATGRDAIRAGMQEMFALDPTLRIEVLEIHEANGIALAHSQWWLVGAATGDRVELSGRGTLVGRKQPDGGWLVVLENTMTPSGPG